MAGREKKERINLLEDQIKPGWAKSGWFCTFIMDFSSKDNLHAQCGCLAVTAALGGRERVGKSGHSAAQLLLYNTLKSC